MTHTHTHTVRSFPHTALVDACARYAAQACVQMNTLHARMHTDLCVYVCVCVCVCVAGLQECMRACNNACWSLGELATKLPVDQVLQWGVAAAERMAALLAAGKSQLPGSLIENAAITLGR